MPTASVTIEPASVPVATSFRVTASPFYREIDYGKAIIPARMVQVIIDGHGSTPTTGRLEVADGHASGEVVFANRTNQPVVVPKGTLVRTSSGVSITFYTVAEITLPPVLYGHERVGIIALEPGTAGNVRRLTINVVEGEVAPQVEVLNDRPTEGGTIQRIGIVAYRDFDQLRAEMIDSLQTKAHADLIAELAEGEFVPRESLDVQVMAQEFDQVVDQRSEVLSMSMKVVARGIAVDEAHIRELASLLLARGAGEGMGIIQSSLRVDRAQSATLDQQSSSLDILVEATGAATQVIDPERVSAAVSGKGIAGAAQWLSEELALQRPPQISVVPPWWRRMPLLPSKTDIVVTAGAS
jgi:hypothetical protein